IKLSTKFATRFMNPKQQFQLDIYKLSNKKHDYEFDISDKFFECFTDSFLKKGKLQVKLTLDKSESMIIADFVIKGSVELTCDRSLEEFDEEIDLEENLIFKYGSEFAEVSEDVITIPKDTHQLDVSQYVYEFIGLAVPMKKLHPKFREEEQQHEDDFLVYTTGSEADTGEEEPDTEASRIWEKLKNLR